MIIKEIQLAFFLKKEFPLWKIWRRLTFFLSAIIYFFFSQLKISSIIERIIFQRRNKFELKNIS
jgi:hypothetical protein